MELLAANPIGDPNPWDDDPSADKLPADKPTYKLIRENSFVKTHSPKLGGGKRTAISGTKQDGSL